MDAAQLGELSKTLIRRATISNLQLANTTEAERALLAAAPRPITGVHAQDFAAWRRAVLWVSGALLLIAVLIELASHRTVAEVGAAEQAKAMIAQGQHVERADLQQMATVIEQKLGKDNLELIDNLEAFHLCVKVAVAVLVLLAARAWSRVSRSRHLARWAWVVSLLVPLAAAAWPWANQMDFTVVNLEHVGVSRDAAKQLFAGMFATAYVMMLAPKVLSIFPGIMRSALTMKTLFPESMQTGWMTVLTAPLFVGFMLLALCVVSQSQGNFLLIGAFLCLAIGPCVYLHSARDLLNPHPIEDASRVVDQIRRRALLFNAAGLVLLAIYLLTNTHVSILTLVHMLLEATGGVLLTMVAFSDLLLALLRFELRQSAAFAGSALEKSYQTRLEELDQTGLTDLAGALRLREEKPPTPA